MTSELDELQRLIKADIEKTYTKTVIDHAMNPRNLGKMDDADGFAQATALCGDTMEIWLKVKDGMITKATFGADGCGSSAAAGSMLTELASGKSIPKAMKLTQQDILNALGGLPEESAHCALLAINTLKEAIKDYLTRKNKPGKKAYRQHQGGK